MFYCVLGFYYVQLKDCLAIIAGSREAERLLK